MTLEQFNGLPFEAAKSAMMECCGCEAWAVEMTASRPYESFEAVSVTAGRHWWRLGEFGWVEAFRAHPRESNEIERAARLKKEYYATFGFSFVFCGDGKSDEDVLEALTKRVEHRPEEELAQAAREQVRITQTQLERLFGV